MRCLNLLLGLLFIPSLLLLFGGSYANAASDYDILFGANHVVTPETARGYQWDFTEEEWIYLSNLTENPNSWISQFSQACLQTNNFDLYEEAMDYYNDDNYYYALTNITTGNYTGSWIIHFFEKNTSDVTYTKLNNNTPAFGMTSTTSSYNYSWYFNDSNVSWCGEKVVNPAGFEYITWTNNISKLYITNIDIYENAPQDFEPTIVPPTEYQLPAETNNAVPDIDLHLDNIYKAQIFDRNFFTFDNNPFLCDGLAPVIDWTIYDQDSITILDQVTLSATGTYTYQFEKTFEASEYLVTAQYRCDSYNFPNQSSREIKFNNVGQLQISNPFEGCFTEEFPWIDLNTCGQNIIDLFTKGLSINRMIFGDEWAPDEDCRQLAILDDWLGVNPQNNNICPFFSTEVRAIITPFVTFIIGLLIIRFVANLRKGL